MTSEKTALRLVRQAERLVLADLRNPPAVAAISQSLGVSDRTLRNVFKRTLGVSPNQYLRLLRLSRARRALLSARRPTVTVTDVAIRHGFRELGRFSVEYREMFGECPSATLRKAVRKPGQDEYIQG